MTTLFQRYPFLIFLFFLFLSACSMLWEKDNTPPPSSLVRFTPTIKIQPLWSNRTGSGVGREYLKLGPVITDNQIITSDQFGTLTAVDKYTGKTQWKSFINVAVTSGPAVDDDLIVLGIKNGDVIVLTKHNRQLVWKTHVGSEILAKPVIHNNIVLIKSIDGQLNVFSRHNGQLLWNHQDVEPNFILRGSSTPQISHGAIIAGFANGKITQFSENNGRELWTQTVALPEGAFAIQRMIDIDADPIISQNRVFAGTYQGKLAAFDFDSGKMLWDHNISSFTGIAADSSHVYVSDAKSFVWAFDRESGNVAWKQTQLEARNITGPVIVGDYLVVGDGQGFLHWINKRDGSFAGRVQVGETSIIANPVTEDKTVYAITKDGYLAAYTFHE